LEGLSCLTQQGTKSSKGLKTCLFSRKDPVRTQRHFFSHDVLQKALLMMEPVHAPSELPECSLWSTLCFWTVVMSLQTQVVNDMATWSRECLVQMLRCSWPGLIKGQTEHLSVAATPGFPGGRTCCSAGQCSGRFQSAP
jgi:hypothetical protein